MRSAMAPVWREEVAVALRPDAALAFAHGFNVHYQQIEPRADLDVIMIAPKGPGHLVRSTYTHGAGVPSLMPLVTLGERGSKGTLPR